MRRGDKVITCTVRGLISCIITKRRFIVPDFVIWKWYNRVYHTSSSERTPVTNSTASPINPFQRMRRSLNSSGITLRFLLVYSSPPPRLAVFEEALRILCSVEHGREGELRVARGEDDDGLGPGGLVQVVDLSDQVVST